ncbi:MAG: chromate transporter [Coprococcus sp.]|nr:chromate transporter [Coprococcus sp.]
MKIGAFTFGGGYAMISVIEDICVERKKWMTHDDMVNVTVVAESTPGPIAINCATFVGSLQAGIPGAAAATIGIVVPSFFIIFIISLFLDNFLEITIVANAFRGIRIAVGVLIIHAAVTMLKNMHKDLFSCLLLGGAFLVMLLSDLLFWNFSSILLLFVAGAAGFFFYMIQKVLLWKGGQKK